MSLLASALKTATSSVWTTSSGTLTILMPNPLFRELGRSSRMILVDRGQEEKEKIAGGTAARIYYLT